MGWLDRARKAVSDIFNRDRFEREMDEELRGFLDLAAEDRERTGATPSDARRTARLSLGGVEACKENARDVRVGAALDSLARDAGFSIRLLRRNPSFAIAAILTIALGTFPLAATAGLANAVFFRPAPGVTGADGLVHVEFVTHDETGDRDNARLSYLNHADLMNGLRGLTGLAGHSGGSASIAVPGMGALHVDVNFVMHDYFRVLGMRMAAGRHFAPEEDREPGGTPVVILGHMLATTLFGNPEGAPGRSVQVNGLDFTVVGVTPPEFRGLQNDHYSQMWLPGSTSSYARHVPRDRWDRRRGSGLFESFVGRLAPNVDLQQARAELTVATRALADAYPAENRHFHTAEILVERRPGMSFAGGNPRKKVTLMVTLFVSAGVLLLLLAAANVGNLLFFRGARRRDEMALRSALGASRWRLLRAHLMDVSLISLLGGAVGLLLTFWIGRLLEGIVIPEAGFLRLPIDWRVAGLVLAGSVLVGLVFGGAPALFASSGGGLTLAVHRAGNRRGRRIRDSLTVMQLAISLSLLVGAMLLLVTIRNLVRVDIGFDPARIASATIFPRDNGYDDARSLVFYRELLDRAGATPAVAAVSVSTGAPMISGISRTRVQLPGRDREQAIAVATNGVTSDYFDVLSLPLLTGRSFSQGEAFGPPDDTCGPVVVSESLARLLFGTSNALERVVVIARSPRRAPMECRVVGVAADVRGDGPGAEWEPILYRPLGRSGLLRVTVLARSDGPPSLASAALREAAASIDPAIPLYGRTSLTEGIEFQMAGRRIISSVLGLVALLGLLMAAVGLYGLVAETVVDRTREFAVRMAIGAGPRSILMAVLRQALVLAGIGIGVGIALSAGLSRTIRSQLFGVTEMAPWVYLSAAGLLAAIVVLASLAPAVRATRMNPVDVLRAD
ncbi:MAG: ABC transporter permease [Vicinamibacterales bacterium]